LYQQAGREFRYLCYNNIILVACTETDITNITKAQGAEAAAKSTQRNKVVTYTKSVANVKAI